MSYILEALKRAERERSSAVPEHTGAAATPASRGLRPATIALAGATLFLAGIGVAALVLRPSTPAPVPEPAPESPGAEAAQASPAVSSTPAPAVAATAQPLLGEVAELAAYESLDDVSPVFQGSPTVAPTTAPTVAPASPAATPQTPARSAGTDGTDGTALRQAGTATPQADEAARQLPPRLGQMPDDFQSRFPSPVIQVHVFDADPARRWVMIDNRRHGESGVLDSGLRVAEILSDGVIFEFDGSRVYWPLNR